MYKAAVNSFIKGTIQKLSAVFFTAICGLMPGVSANALAESTAGSTYSLDTHVTNAFDNTVLHVSKSDLPYHFELTLQSGSGSPTASGNLYLGVIAPDGQTTYTFVQEGDTSILVKGLQPILTDLELPAVQDIRAEADLRITGSEKKGLYIVFALLVRTGGSPSDTTKWLSWSLDPLFVD